MPSVRMRLIRSFPRITALCSSRPRTRAFSLPVTPPASGWCTALLNTSGSNVSLGNSGNRINGAAAAHISCRRPGNSVQIFSDGSAYWVTGGTGANGTNGPPTNGAVSAQGHAGPAGAVGCCARWNRNRSGHERYGRARFRQRHELRSRERRQCDLRRRARWIQRADSIQQCPVSSRDSLPR